MVGWAKKIVEKKGLKGYAFGHTGSRNLHMEILGVPEKEANGQRIREAEEEIIHLALEWGGTATGEHGIGIEKKVCERRTWGKSPIDETDQKTFRPQWNHEPRQDL
jgi:D-lactate dehydrogenase (cytochrome)